MASRLCCTAEQEGRPGSPELPNVRVSDSTPAKLPLLPKVSGSPGSHFTSAHSGELHELRQIFESAKDSEDSKLSSPTKPHHAPFARPSVYSLRSIHKMKSIHALIKRKFSRDLAKANPPSHLRDSSPKKKPATENPDTVVKVPREGPNTQLKITKADLRKNLLSDKKPEEGGYDPDAEVLDDVAKNIGKKLPSKRPSIHSVEWQSSPTSKQTPASSTSRCSPPLRGDTQPYQIISPGRISKPPIASRFSQFTSSPNLRFNTSKSKDRELRRSHSATSIDFPVLSPLSPTRLPSMTLDDPDTIPWSKSMHESFRLSHFPTPPPHLSSKPSSSSLHAKLGSKEMGNKQSSDEPEVSIGSGKAAELVSHSRTDQLRIHVQQPTSLRVSGSVHACVRKNVPLVKKTSTKEGQDEDREDDSRHSVHLYSMRISHHLRSGSLLPWDNLADAPEVPPPSRPFRNRTLSNQSCVSHVHQLSQRTRHERQTSSSGFASSGVPSKWGRVLPQDRDHREEMSSIYSSRPQSPPDSFGGSMINLSRSVTHLDSLRPTAAHVAQRRHSDSCPPTNNETMSRLAKQDAITNSKTAESTSPNNLVLEAPIPFARNNSVANTKKSKFREEFSPSPPRKKPSASIMKFLNSKRNSVRSQSEANLKAESFGVDGPFDHPQPSPNRERRLSRSLMCLQVEQNAAGKEKLSTDTVWEKALKVHQEERASLFLPDNKDLANQASPFRKRSESILRPKGSSDEDILPLQPLQPLHASKRLSVPFLEAPTFSASKRFSAPFLETTPLDEPTPTFVPALFKRRRAIVYKDEDSGDPTHEVQVAFDRQTDDATTVGAWGRYPSHSRPGRSNSAGRADNVQPRDFALEHAVRFAMGGNIHGDEEIDPTTRPKSPPLINGRKRKKRVGSGRMAKSNSMTFGKQFLKNYTKIFRSQSTEFQRHGYGHRSSITTGGMLEYPELEILPEVWRRGLVEERSQNNSDESPNAGGGAEGSGTKDKKGKGKMEAEDSMATLRPTNRSADNSIVALDDTTATSLADRARIWSVYYEDCIPGFSRASLDWSHSPDADDEDLELRALGRMPSRHSFDLSRHSTTRHHSTMPACLTKHSRHGSRMSHVSIVSHSSARPSFISMGKREEGELDGADEKSVISVRRSTMDLITMYREQEIMERERVLSLVRLESMRTTSRKSERKLGVMAV